MRKIGQVGIGQTVSSEQAEQARTEANSMLAKWGNRRLLLYTVNSRSFVLTALKQDYTVGQSGTPDFNQVRPTFVETGIAVTPGSTMENTLNILDKPKWGAIRDKGALCSANGAPQDVWPEYTFPNLTFHVWPIPTNAAVTIKLGTWERLQQFATIFDVLSLPDGYEEAIAWNLALALAPDYDMPTQPLAQQAADSLLAIQQINAQGLGGALGESETLTAPTVGQPQPAAASAPPQG